jgi:hypothetical protein
MQCFVLRQSTVLSEVRVGGVRSGRENGCETRARMSWYGILLVSTVLPLSLSLSPCHLHLCRFHSLRQNAQTPPTHASRLARRRPLSSHPCPVQS